MSKQQRHQQQHLQQQQQHLSIKLNHNCKFHSLQNVAFTVGGHFVSHLCFPLN
jgi:hypothetical protein